MNRFLDLSQVSTPVLKGIRKILSGGTEANATESKAGKLARALREENELLKKTNERRDVVEAAGLEWDESYYMAFNDKHFLITVRNLSRAMKEAEASVKVRTMLIPPLSAYEELEGIEGVREHLRNRRNGGSD